jgi:ABC-2 type transport system ATP-binding protein
MISVKDFTKKYRDFKATDNVSLTARPGEITVLLGPNGAGKSTTIKSIAGLLNYEGDIKICSHLNKSVEAKRIFGYVPETPALYDLLTVVEHIEFIAKAYQLEEGWKDRADAILKRLELFDKKDKLVRELSKGMAQKVSIAMALVIKPMAVMFDEPMMGLDPKAINEMLVIFSELKNEGASILISTHIIDTINEVWDRAYIMDKGRIICEIARKDLVGEELKELFFELTEEDNK